MARRTAVLKSLARTWTPFERAEITEEMRTEHKLLKHCFAIYHNSRFEVQCFQVTTPIGGVMQMTAFRHGNIDEPTWEELQRIKIELFGPEAVAVEVYPAVVAEWPTKTRVRFLWILPSTWQLPFGLEKPGAWGAPE